MNEVLYKWLIKDTRPPVQGGVWPVAIGEWTPEAKPILCESGWHGVHAKDVAKHPPHTEESCTLYVVSAKELIEGDDKFATSSMRLDSIVGRTNEKVLRLFGVRCAREVLANYEAFVPGDTRVRDCIDVAKRFILGTATDEERSAAWSAAGSAAWSAAWSAAGSVAWSAAGSAAWSAAESARSAAESARSAAESGAWSAARSAARYRQSEILIDLLVEFGQ